MTARSPERTVPLALGCVTETFGPYLDQAARLLLSLRWFGGTAAELPFILAVVGQLDAKYADFFRRHDARIVEVKRFSERHGPSNKLRFFELDLLDQFTHVLLLDCDTLVVDDPSPWMTAPGFRAKPADLPTVAPDSLAAYLSERGLAVPEGQFHHDLADEPGLAYFNSGAILLETRCRRTFIEAWIRHDRDLIENAEQFDIAPFHVDQASLTAALAESGIPFSALPSRMNLAVHKPAERYSENLFETDPTVLHYHQLVTSEGYLRRLPLPRAQAKAQMFNSRLRAALGGLPPRPTRLTETSPKVVVGSGWWSDPKSDSEWRIGSDRTRSARFFHLWYRQVLHCLSPTRVIVTDSDSPDRPDVTGYADLEWVALDRNYGHANDLRTGQINTDWCGWTRSVVQGAMFALCCDADWYVYVEQDCLLHGENFLANAVGNQDADIFLGTRTTGGVGIEGKPAAPMHQNSLMVVRNSGLRRFITGILEAEESDGERSPELKLETSCAPFAELAVPFGRSRPIDFSLDHFYAQHLGDDELDRFMEVIGPPPADGGLSLFDL